MTESAHIVVVCTAPSRAEADAIADAALAGRLAGSAQIAEVDTRYRWRGTVHRAREHRIELFTRGDRFDALAACIRDHHSYEVPQIVALPIAHGTAAFLSWIDQTSSP